MDKLPSSEFRKTFARLTEPTIVTVNGHSIGMWAPVAALNQEAERILRGDGGQATSASVREERERIDAMPTPFRSRPFTPVPKHR